MYDVTGQQGSQTRARMEDERRKWPRQNLFDPGIGILHQTCTLTGNPDSVETHAFVQINDFSIMGASFTTDCQLVPGSFVNLLLYDPNELDWRIFGGQVVWVDDEGKSRSAGMKYLLNDLTPGMSCEVPLGSKRPHATDMSFLLNTSLLGALMPQSLCPLLNCLKQTHFKAGERIMSQGDEGDAMYIIRKGSCTVSIETECNIHPVAKLREGDVVGEMAVLTGEPRSAHVDADTDISLWKLDAADFTNFAETNPDIRIFLTELAARRFETSPHTSDRTIGKYVIRQKLGKGGWSLVYQGAHKELNMPVAIKMMRHDMAMEPEFIETFRKEAEFIAPMNHPNIIKIYDIEECYRTVFIIMELMDGQCLREILDLTPVLPFERAVSFLIQICSGLDFAHRQNIVHRDIKPENIFITPDDQVKILDFGLACTPGTEDMSIAGTVKYAPPEQIDGDPVDARADIYSMGIMAYEMLAGKRPYPEDDLTLLMDLHCDKDIPDPAKDIPGIPEGLKHFIIKSCKRDPAQRYQTAADAVEDLKTISQSMGIQDYGLRVGKKRMTSMFLFFEDDQQLALTQLLENVSRQASELGVTIKLAEFKDI